MTNSYKFGDGLLIVGPTPMDITAQMTEFSVQWSENVETTPAIPVLDNTEIPEEEEATFKATATGVLLQDLAADAIVDYSWEHKGEELDLIFVPHNPAVRGVKGVIVMVPLKVGGAVTKPRNRPTSDFTWRFVGDPIFGVFDPGAGGHADDDVDEDV